MRAKTWYHVAVEKARKGEEFDSEQLMWEEMRKLRSFAENMKKLMRSDVYDAQLGQAMEDFFKDYFID